MKTTVITDYKTFSLGAGFYRNFYVRENFELRWGIFLFVGPFAFGIGKAL